LSYDLTAQEFDTFLQSSNINNGINTKKINEDIYLFDFNFDISKEYLNVEAKNSFLPEGLYLNILLSGNYQYDSANIDLLGKQNFTTISNYVDNNPHRNMKFQRGSYKSMGIYVKGKFLEKHLDIVLDEKYNTIIKNKPTNIKTGLCASEIYNSSFTGTFHELLLESKVLEILLYEFSDIKASYKDVKELVLSDYDKEALYKAKEILIANMKNPPSIVKLAKMVNLNEFKLKKGFKKLFNITPYNMLNHHRLELAKDLLQNSEMSASEISSEIGFKHQGYLTKCFTQKYGITPKELMKSRKYYY